MTACIEEARRLLRLAGRDLLTCRILSGHPQAPLPAVCFHAQQCAEKALKAVLTAAGAIFPRTHDLEALAALAADRGIDPPLATREFRKLNPCAVEFRYDDESIPLISADEADTLAALILAWAECAVTEGVP